MKELAAKGIPVVVTCRVLNLARLPYYRWLAVPVADSEVVSAQRTHALFDAHRDDPEFGYRFLVEKARDAGHPMCERTAWRNCADNKWSSVFGQRQRGKNGKAGPPVHNDLFGLRFTAPRQRTVKLCRRLQHGKWTPKSTSRLSPRSTSPAGNKTYSKPPVKPTQPAMFIK